MRRKAKWTLGVVAVFGLGACSESPPPTASAEIGSTLSSNLAEQPGEEIASGIAQALANPTIRLSVLQAFRASPWVEHKLVLQQFITTAAGQELVAAVATTRGITAAQFTGKIHALPPLDFYVPSRTERLSWSGENTVGVALSTSMRVVPTSAHTSDGGTIPFASAHDAGRVLILLHPSEAKGRRMQRQAALVGSRIQDGDDGDIAVQFIQKLRSGDTVVYDLKKTDNGKWVTMQADGSTGKELAIAVQERARQAGRSMGESEFLSECDEQVMEDCGGGGGGGGSSYTNVTYIKTRSVCDMDCTASNEFEFRAKAYNNISNALVLQGTARITGVESGFITPDTWIDAAPMIATTTASGVWIDVNVVETDPWPNPDDNFDPNPALHSVSDKNTYFHIGDNRPWSFCTSGEPVCRELSVSFNW